jgi:hypothetical protein
MNGQCVLVNGDRGLVLLVDESSACGSFMKAQHYIVEVLKQIDPYSCR